MQRRQFRVRCDGLEFNAVASAGFGGIKPGVGKPVHVQRPFFLAAFGQSKACSHDEARRKGFPICLAHRAANALTDLDCQPLPSMCAALSCPTIR